MNDTGCVVLWAPGILGRAAGELRRAIADLLLLNDGTLVDIASTERIEAVLAHARLLRRGALDGLIATAEASLSSN